MPALDSRFVRGGLSRAGYRWGVDGDLWPPISDDPTRQPVTGFFNPAVDDPALVGDTWLITEADWPDFPWNPHRRWNYDTEQFELADDPNAGPKPTWAQVVRAVESFRLELESVDAGRRAVRKITDARDKFALAPVGHRHAGAEVYVGGTGIDHMTAMIKHSQDASSAGYEFPVAVLRDVEGGTLELHTPEETEELLGPLAKQTNISPVSYTHLTLPTKA